MHKGNPVLNIQIRGQWCIDGPSIYIYLLNVLSFSSRYFKLKRTSRLGRLLALSLEILYELQYVHITSLRQDNYLFSSPEPKAHGRANSIPVTPASVSSMCGTLASMTSRRQIQDGGPHTSGPRWRPPRHQDGGPTTPRWRPL